MAERGGAARRGGGQKDMQQTYLIRRVVAIVVAVLVLFSCCMIGRATIAAISSFREQLAAKPEEAPKVQRLKPKPKPVAKPKVVVAWQPSHQDDTGDGEWHEYKISGAIVDYAISAAAKVKSVKAWDISSGLSGSNSAPSNTEAFDRELATANAAKATYFVSVHVGTDGESGVKGFYMPGDSGSKILAQRLVAAVAAKTGAPNKGVEEQELYSLEHDKNKAKYRVLVEVGGSDEEIQKLQVKKAQQDIGKALASVVNALAP